MMVNVTWIILLMFLVCFWTLIIVVSLLYGGSESSRISSKYLNLCFEDEQRSYRFGLTWGWVIHDRTFIFGWTIPLNCSSNLQMVHNHISVNHLSKALYNMYMCIIEFACLCPSIPHLTLLSIVYVQDCSGVFRQGFCMFYDQYYINCSAKS